MRITVEGTHLTVSRSVDNTDISLFTSLFRDLSLQPMAVVVSVGKLLQGHILVNEQ